MFGFNEEEIVIVTPGKKKNKQNIQVYKNKNGKETRFKRNNLTRRQAAKYLPVEPNMKQAMMQQQAMLNQGNTFPFFNPHMIFNPPVFNFKVKESKRKRKRKRNVVS
jgi:hypothetical protein